MSLSNPLLLVTSRTVPWRSVSSQAAVPSAATRGEDLVHHVAAEIASCQRAGAVEVGPHVPVLGADEPLLRAALPAVQRITLGPVNRRVAVGVGGLLHAVAVGIVLEVHALLQGAAVGGAVLRPEEVVPLVVDFRSPKTTQRADVGVSFSCYIA